MSNKKIRGREKREQKKLTEETKAQETKSRKGRALVNMGIVLSLLLLFYMSQFMNSTFDKGAKLVNVSSQLKSELNIDNATALSIVPSNNSLFVLYEKDNKLGLVEGKPHKILSIRYSYSTDLGVTDKKLSTKIINVENSSKTSVLLYGDLTDTLASKVTVAFNGETKTYAVEERGKFITNFDFANNTNTDVTIKVIDKDGNDITNELQ